jgi:hypothetical protein
MHSTCQLSIMLILCATLLLSERTGLLKTNLFLFSHLHISYSHAYKLKLSPSGIISPAKVVFTLKPLPIKTKIFLWHYTSISTEAEHP